MARAIVESKVRKIKNSNNLCDQENRREKVELWYKKSFEVCLRKKIDCEKNAALSISSKKFYHFWHDIISINAKKSIQSQNINDVFVIHFNHDFIQCIPFSCCHHILGI